MKPSSPQFCQEIRKIPLASICFDFAFLQKGIPDFNDASRLAVTDSKPLSRPNLSRSG